MSAAGFPLVGAWTRAENRRRAGGGGWGEISYERMAQLRRERPVARTGSGLWYLSRYWDCRRVFEDNKTFSNVGGLRAPGVVIPPEERMINEMEPPEDTR